MQRNQILLFFLSVYLINVHFSVSCLIVKHRLSVSLSIRKTFAPTCMSIEGVLLIIIHNRGATYDFFVCVKCCRDCPTKALEKDKSERKMVHCYLGNRLDVLGLFRATGLKNFLP